MAHAAELIAEGAVLGVKGLGGYHLACLADSDTAVAKLRARKHREDKPFALMAPDLAAAEALIEMGSGDRELLQAPERPIVIARRRPGAAVASSVAPRSRDLGVMLPYTPLHHLLLADIGRPLVMTSANVSDEPIAYLDEDALARLREIADAFLVHDRPIHMRTDDSVVRVLGDQPGRILHAALAGLRADQHRPAGTRPGARARLRRRAQEHVLRGEGRAGLGGPPHRRSQELGDARVVPRRRRSLPATVRRHVRVWLRTTCTRTTSPRATRSSGRASRRVAVQHHHAHLAACLAEHGERGPAVGAIFDGTGYGSDGTVWGGELLTGGLGEFERAGMLMPVRLPGGDAAVGEPWRMAASWLAHAFDEEVPEMPAALAAEAEADWEAVCGMVRSGAGSPVTTSVGRLFDAVAALCGIRARVNYEGQAAAELEGMADPAERGDYRIELEGGAGAPLVLDPRGAIRALESDVDGGTAVPVVAARFHNGLAAATAAACARECERSELDLVVLSGGVFQNRLLLERTLDGLHSAGLRTLIPEKLPPNDGGIAYGQVAVASARLR